MSSLLECLFSLCDEFEASDIHLGVGLRPRFRIRGELVEKGDFRPFDTKAVDEVSIELGLSTLPVGTHEGTERIRLTLLKDGAIDGAVTSPSGSRFRFNVFREKAQHAVALRRLDSTFRPFSELGLPPRLEDLCRETDGLVVVSGPTGSGKSTTLATMIDSINHQRNAHIITIEDPIEFVHASDRCLVHQRQVGRDATSFGEALVEALRQDPDVILVGEVRDLDTVRTALRAAETGHLVFTTLHSGDCASAVERIVSMFPTDEQSSARRQLSLVLRGICVQHLMPSVDRTRRHPACELLVNTTAAANIIVTGRTAQLYSIIESGAAQGMLSLDASLAELVSTGRVDLRRALALSRSPETLRRRLDRKGGGLS